MVKLINLICNHKQEIVLNTNCYHKSVHNKGVKFNNEFAPWGRDLVSVVRECPYYRGFLYRELEILPGPYSKKSFNCK